ncbi:MAG: type II secretion system F family protein [Anaerolineae bacterium]
MQIALILGVFLMLTVAASAWIVSRLVRGQSGVIQSRLETYAARGRMAESEKREKRTVAVQLDQELRKRRFGQRLADDLARADMQLRLSEFFMLSVLSAVFGVLLGLLLFSTPVIALLTGVLSYFLPRMYVKRKQTQRIKAFNDQLADAMRLIVSSLKSGYSMLQSMEVVSSELPEPIGGEFGRVVREVSIGLSQEQALNNMVLRVHSEDLDMMATAVNVQHEVGGNLSEILDTISETIRERVRIQGEIRVLTSQQVYSGYLVTLLPFAVTGVLFMLNRAYIMQLFQDFCGLAMVGLAVLMIAVGYLIIRKIVRIEV